MSIGGETCGGFFAADGELGKRQASPGEGVHRLMVGGCCGAPGGGRYGETKRGETETMDLLNYVVDQALVLIPVLLVIGQIIKAIPAIPNWLIPVILLVPGVVGAGFLCGWTAQGIVQGILVTGAAVYGNQLYKQIQKGD
ncbi:MAG: phage holin family protein [Christensenellales bacterium]